MVSAVSGKSGAGKPSIINRLKVFLTEVWVELKKARWPSRKELFNLTTVVVIAVLAVAFYIYAADSVMAVISEWAHIFPKIPGR